MYSNHDTGAGSIASELAVPLCSNGALCLT
jgi:hypothetical protein